MTETPVAFGPACALFGVLTLPYTVARPRHAFLMFNAGVLSHIGPHRMNVKLARALAGAGEVAMRFDLSGHGDSGRVETGKSSVEQAVQDIRCAMDFLEKEQGIETFSLIGVCSGAVNAYAAALADSRVVGLLMFDGYWYRTRWTTPVRDWKRFRSVSWAQGSTALVRRAAQWLRPQTQPVRQSIYDDGSNPTNPPREDFVSAIQKLVIRHTSVFIIYSGSVIDYYSYRRQFRDAFGKEMQFDQVQCAFRPEIDHTFLTQNSQQEMIQLVLGWASDLKRATVTHRAESMH